MFDLAAGLAPAALPGLQEGLARLDGDTAGVELHKALEATMAAAERWAPLPTQAPPPVGQASDRAGSIGFDPAAGIYDQTRILPPGRAGEIAIALTLCGALRPGSVV